MQRPRLNHFHIFYCLGIIHTLVMCYSRHNYQYIFNVMQTKQLNQTITWSLQALKCIATDPTDKSLYYNLPQATYSFIYGNSGTWVTGGRNGPGKAIFSTNLRLCMHGIPPSFHKDMINCRRCFCPYQEQIIILIFWYHFQTDG